MVGGWSGGHGVVGGGDGEFAFWAEVELPAVVVDVVVVAVAEWDEVVEVGVSAVSPVFDVVWLVFS